MHLIQAYLWWKYNYCIEYLVKCINVNAFLVKVTEGGFLVRGLGTG